MTFDSPEARGVHRAIAFYDELTPRRRGPLRSSRLTIPFVSNAWLTEETSDLACSTAFRTHPLQRRAGPFFWLP